MIRVLLVDDHPALRTGLTAVLRAEPGIVPLGAAESVADLWPALQRTKPDVVLLDYHLPVTDGLVLCRQIKRTLNPPAVLLYSAYADASLVIPAVLAGADGLVNKAASAHELCDAIRAAGRGQRVLPPISRELLQDAHDRLDTEDLPIMAMTLDGTPPSEVARVMKLEPTALSARMERMISQLKVEVPQSSLPRS